MSAGRSRKALWAAAAVAVGLATSALYAVSRGKWSDPIIDSGREWIVPDALARGELLYRDVVYWFGPFTPYFQAAFFWLFGSGLRTLVLAGAVGSLATLAALYYALRAVTLRAEAALWTALAIPALVFMPNAGGSLFGMGFRIWHAASFTLLAIGLACRLSKRRAKLALLAAGSLAALAGLCRTEWGLVSLIAVLVCGAIRERSQKPFLRDAALATGAFLFVFGGALGFFIARAGADAVVCEGHVLLTGLPQETRTFLVAFSGVRDWGNGVLQLLYSAGMWLGAFLVVEVMALRADGGEMRSRAGRLVFLLAALALLAALGGASGAVLFSGAPLVCLGALMVGLRRTGHPRGAAAVAFGLAGLLLSYRRPFHIGDSAYVGPSLVFAFVSAPALLQLAVASESVRRFRVRLRGALMAAVGVLILCSFAGRAAQYASDGRIAIPGTDGMLSARAAVAGEIAVLAQTIRRVTAPGEGLVAFPEGEILNLLSGRRNPIRHKLYLPGYLTAENEGQILAELSQARPAAVVIWQRPTSEYGRGFFGVDYGRSLRRWIDLHYEPRAFGSRTLAHRQILFAIRRSSDRAVREQAGLAHRRGSSPGPQE